MSEDTSPAEPNAAERNLAMACHLSSLVGIVIPFGNIFAPLIIWLIKREESPFVDAHGREAVNFQISLTIYIVVSTILTIVVIGLLLLFGLVIFWLVVTIQAAIRSNRGEPYRYPLTIRLIK